MKSKFYILFVLVVLLVACSDNRKETVNREIEAIKLLIDEGGQTEEYFKKVKSKLEKISAVAANNPHYWVQKSRFELSCGYYSKLCDKQGVWQRALKNIEYAKTLDSDNVEVLSLMGHIYRNLKRYKESEDNLLKALNEDSTHAWANLNFAMLIEERIYPEGIKPQDKDFMDRRSKRIRKAFDSIKLVLEGDYRRREQLVALKYCDKLAKHLDFSDRKYCYESALKKQFFKNYKEEAWAHGNYASMLVTQGYYTEGMLQAKKALKIMNYPHARMTLAAAYIGLWSETGYKNQELFDNAISIYPKTKMVDVVIQRLYRMILDDELMSALHKNAINLSARTSNGKTLLGYQLIPVSGKHHELFDRVKNFIERYEIDVDIPFYEINILGGKRKLTTPIKFVEDSLEGREKGSVIHSQYLLLKDYLLKKKSEPNPKET